MTQVHINKLDTVVDATGGPAPLSPQAMERIVAEVLRRLEEMQAKQCRQETISGLRNSVLDDRRPA